MIAGAGYGKTQAVSGIFDFNNENVIWFQISQLDNLITRFWERFIYAFKSHSQRLWENLMFLGYPGTMAAFDRFLRLLAKELPVNKRFVIVFDDFHFIHDKAVINFLENLIEARISNISIILISRTKPDLNLTGMLSKGLLARITEDDLRFSEDEMSHYFTQRGLNLGENMLANIYSCTEGWIFAIYLIGLSIQKGNVCEHDPVFLAKLDIFELIDREIFGIASRKLKTFLIKISLLDGMPKGLLLDLANNDDSILEEMSRISLFLRYDSFLEIYRLHHLFRDFLLERKNRLSEEEKKKVHLTAAKWYEKNNFKFEAVDQYKACDRYDEIFNIIMSLSRNVPKDIAHSFVELIEQAPQRFIEKSLL